MVTEDNKALARRFYEDVFNYRNLALVDELCSQNHIFHTPSETLRGREEFKQFLSQYITPFPDARFTVEDLIAEGDKVVSRYTFRGTHKGDLMGIAPTGKQVTITGIVIERIANGKSEEAWLNFDALGMMQQLGKVPAAEQAR